MPAFLHEHSSETNSGDQKRSNHILIWLTVGVLIVGVLALRSRSASSSPGLGYPGNTPTGGGNTDNSGVGGAFGAIDQQLAGIQTQLSDVQNKNQQDLANLDTSWQQTFSGLASSQQQEQSQTQGWVTNLTDQLKQQLDTLAKLGSQTAANTQTISGLSQSDYSGQQGLSGSLIDQLNRNGEHIVDSVKSTTGGMLYLTNKGGVYADNGANFFGSYEGYAAHTKNPGAEIAGHGDFGSGHIQALAGGNYTITNNRGENYTFNPQTKAMGY